MTLPTVAFVGLGGNLGDRAATLRSGLAQLRAHAGVQLLEASHLYETEAVGPSSEPFLNASARLRTSLEPRALLDVLHGIERDHGRTRRVRWDARTLDLDLLLVLDRGVPVVSDDPACRLPHPSMLERDFVLAPLAELEPALIIEGRSLSAHLRALPAAARTILRRDAPLVDPAAELG